MNFVPAPMPDNESRRQEAVERLQIKGTDQHDVMIVYSEICLLYTSPSPRDDR